MGDADEDVGNEAVFTFASLGPEIVPPLCEALKTGDARTRRNAAKALVIYKKEHPDAKEIIPALIGALADEDEHVVRQVRYALSGMAPEVMPHLQEALKVGNERLRKDAKKTIKEISEQDE